jgi:hypothetical protein
MLSLPERVRKLEDSLRTNQRRAPIYRDPPLAVFFYLPDQEWELRRQLRLLKARVERDRVCQVAYISLAELVWQPIKHSEGFRAMVDYELDQGSTTVRANIYDYLPNPDWRPLPGLLEERMRALDPQIDLAILWRLAPLAPDMHRVANLLDQLKGRIQTPGVLFVPSTTENIDIRFSD